MGTLRARALRRLRGSRGGQRLARRHASVFDDAVEALVVVVVGLDVPLAGGPWDGRVAVWPAGAPLRRRGAMGQGPRGDEKMRYVRGAI